MKLVHYTNIPLTKIEYREQNKEHFKPTGFWVSDEDDFGWNEWCTGEDFNTENLILAYEITLTEYNNVKIVHTAEGIKELTHIFKVEDRWYLNWNLMRMQWDGLIITPYQWSLRLNPDHSWYYTWDCACGCIWNPAVVADIRRFDTCQKSS